MPNPKDLRPSLEWASKADGIAVIRRAVQFSPIFTGGAAQDDADFRLSRFNAHARWVAAAAAVAGGLTLVTGGLVASWHFTGQTQHEYLFFAGGTAISLFWTSVACFASMKKLSKFYTISKDRADEAERLNDFRSQRIEIIQRRASRGQEGGADGERGTEYSPSASGHRVIPIRGKVR